MVRALSPEEKTIQFKGRIEKEVEIRFHQSLVCVKFPKYHTPTVEKRGHPSLRSRVCQLHDVVRRVLSVASYIKEVEGRF